MGTWGGAAVPLSGLELGLTTWVLLVVLGGFLGLDAVSWPQAMLSRPLVAGTLGGLVLGQPGAGFLAGAWLELLALRHPPYGAARYPDTGPAGLVAGFGYAAAGGEGFLPLLVVVLGGWAVGWAGARSVHALRLWNGRLVGDVPRLAQSPERLRRRHRVAVRMDWLRAAVVTAVFLVPLALVARLAAGFPPAGPEAPAVTAAVAGLALALGAGTRVLGTGRRGLPLLLAGAAGALLLWA